MATEHTNNGDKMNTDTNAIFARTVTTSTGSARVGDVVQFVGRRRQFVITGISPLGAINMVALSGSRRGSAPSGHVGGELAYIETPAVLTFTGKDARRLAGRARDAFRHAMIDASAATRKETAAGVNALGARIKVA
jgi:hypothetical protein